MTRNQEETRCNLCSETCLKLYDLYDDRYGYPGYFKLFRCIKCGHKELEGNFLDEFLTELYSRYYPRSSFKLEDYKPAKEACGFKAWFDGAYSSPFHWVPENVRVVDIGCGFGETLGYYESRGCDAYGVEADENIRRVADKFGYKVHVGLFAPDIYQPDFFDYVTMAQVVEHLTDPVATLKGVKRILKPGGIAILSIPNSEGWGARVFGRKWINWHVPYHIQHFSLQSMETAAKEAGLTIERHKTITSSEWLYYQWVHLATYPKMGEPSVFWSQKSELNFKQKLVIGLLSYVHRTKINHLITRLFDGMRLGDNSIFILRNPSVSEHSD